MGNCLKYKEGIEKNTKNRLPSKQEVLDAVAKVKQGFYLLLYRYLLVRGKEVTLDSDIDDIIFLGLDLDDFGYKTLGVFEDLDDAKNFIKNLNKEEKVQLGFSYKDNGELDKIYVCIKETNEIELAREALEFLRQKRLEKFIEEYPDINF